MKHLILIGALLFSTASIAESRVVIIDGDTVDIAGERIRILNIDAPETRGARCERELVLGLRAKERLSKLLRASQVSIQRCESSGRCTDGYGRTLARLRTAEGDVGAVLIAEGLALPWAAGAAAKEQRIMTWCSR